MEKNLILKSGFRLFRVDNYEDIRNEKVVRITCAEQGDDIDWEDDASYFPTKEEILLIIKKLEESIITSKNSESSFHQKVARSWNITFCNYTSVA